MPLPIAPLLGFLSDNLTKRRSVMPMSSRKTTRWAAGLDIPAGGETVLYTGLMYQIIPALTSSEKTMSLVQDSWVGQLLSFGRTVNRFVNLTSFMPPADRQEQKRYDQYLRNIVQLLRKAGVTEFGYLYGSELYTGALVRDLGVDDAFEQHARKVHKMLDRQGVRRVITVDPHTTDMLRNVYPKLVPGYNLEVKSYLEVLRESEARPKNRLESEAVIHDSCLYARYLDTVEQPRRLLEKAGVTARDPEFSGKMTFCCGGPVESLFPDKAGEIAGRRIKQLAEAGNDVVTMCPICLHNLEKAASGNGVSVRDISELLLQAYGG
ncbi:MAG: (Fe-S)-binding protein [Acidobacteria bacterium]|nr:(Fe-S)-binding protein [Acidobacteriota bacterium]